MEPDESDPEACEGYSSREDDDDLEDKPHDDSAKGAASDKAYTGNRGPCDE